VYFTLHSVFHYMTASHRIKCGLLLQMQRDQSLSVCLSVCLSLLFTSVTSAKTAEPIEMPLGVWTRGVQRPDLQNILRQSYDYLTIMSKLRSTYDGRLIYKTPYGGRKAFLRYDSLAKLSDRLR